MKKTVFAQIGVGYWGPNLLRNLAFNDNIKLKTVVDLSPERREFVKSNYPNVRTTDNLNEVLSDDSVQAVVVSTLISLF